MRNTSFLLRSTLLSSKKKIVSLKISHLEEKVPFPIQRYILEMAFLDLTLGTNNNLALLLGHVHPGLAREAS